MMWPLPMSRALLLAAIATSVCVRGQTGCVVDDLAVEVCAQVLEARLLDADLCSNLDAVNEQLNVCEGRFVGACVLHPVYRRVQDFREALRTIESDCEDSACLATTRIDPCVTEIRTKPICSVSEYDIDLATRCIRELMDDCSDAAKLLLEQTLENFLEDIRKDLSITSCSSDGNDANHVARLCMERWRIISNGDVVSLEKICSISQEAVTCLNEVVAANPDLVDTMTTELYTSLRLLSIFGCRLNWDDRVMSNVTGCNYLAAWECYRATALEALVEFAWMESDIYSVTPNRDELCIAVASTSLSPISQCVERHTAACDRENGPRTDLLAFNVNFLDPTEVIRLNDVCDQACLDIATRVDAMRGCLMNRNVDQMLYTEDCTNLNEIVECVNEETVHCLALHRLWRQYGKSTRLAELAQRCGQSLGTKGCLDQEEQKANVESFCNSINSISNVCNDYELHLSCIARHTAGCSALTDSLVEPHLLQLAALNKYFGCQLQYQGWLINVTENGRCALDHYVTCYDPLTTAAGVPALREGNSGTIQAMILNAPERRRSDVELSASSCSALRAVDSDEVIRCVSEIADACLMHRPGYSADPWMINIVRTERSFDKACEAGCLSIVEVDDAEACLDDIFYSYCPSIELSVFVDSSVAEVKCKELMAIWTCWRDQFEGCTVYRDAVNELMRASCSAAFTSCFGEVLQIVAPSAPTDPPIAEATLALPHLLGVMCATTITVLTTITIN